jgi:hypothetical protein
MKTLLILILLVFLPSLALSQSVMVRYEWTQPDSTQAYAVTVGSSTVRLPAVPLRDGELAHYLVFLAVDGDTTQVALVPAPPTLSVALSALVPTPLGRTTSAAVAAVDVRGRVGALSPWSEPLTVYPGPPGRSGRPVVREVVLGP